jgi:hypothetical protein
MGDQGIPWRRVTAEFLAIFAGVSLSLVADDWRQARVDAARERTLLAAVEADLLADSMDLAEVLRGSARTDTIASWLSRHLDDPERPSGSTRSVYRLLWVPFSRPVNATYSGLKAGGELPLISDGELRGMIVDYFERQQPYMQDFYGRFTEYYERWLGTTTPHFTNSPPDSAASLFPPPRLVETSSWQRLSGDHEFRARLLWMGAVGGNWAARIPAVIQSNVKLRSAIRRYLGEV